MTIYFKLWNTAPEDKDLFEAGIEDFGGSIPRLGETVVTKIGESAYSCEVKKVIWDLSNLEQINATIWLLM